MLSRLLLVGCFVLTGTPVPAYAEPDVIDLQAITKPGKIDPNDPSQVILYLKVRNNGPGVAATGSWSWEIKLPGGTESSMGCTIYSPGTHFACDGDTFVYPVGSSMASDDWWIIRVNIVSRPFGNNGFFKLIYANDPNHANDVAPLTIAVPTSAPPAKPKSPATPASSPAAAPTTDSPSASVSETASSAPPNTASDSATAHAIGGGIDGGSVLTTVGVATGGTALLTGLGFFLMRRRRNAAKES